MMRYLLLTMKQLKLIDITEIKAGYQFRDRIMNDPNGEVRVIQMKDVEPDRHIDWDSLIRTKLKKRRTSDLLETGMILFVARGNRNFAVYLNKVPDKSVCSPHFFQLRVDTNAGVIPEFLSWQINQFPAQSYFLKSSEGSGARSIRRGILESLSINIPPLDTQKKIVELDRLMCKEQELYKNLAEKRKLLLTAACTKALKDSRI